MISIVFLVGMVLLWLASSIEIDNSDIYNVSIDLGSKVSMRRIVWPFERDVVGEEGEYGVRIAPNIGRGWKGEAGGEVTYRFYIPQEGKYYLWGYVLWDNACSNAVFAKIDDYDMSILGNDPIFKKWHWIRGYCVDLEKGTHTLQLSNHSDNIALQKISFINSSHATPEENVLIFSDIFYDGFDGCDEGNFSKWEILSGKWYINKSFANNPQGDNVLVAESEDTACFILNEPDFSDYRLNLSLFPEEFGSPENYLSIHWGYIDQKNNYELKIEFESSKSSKVSIIHHRAGIQTILGSASTSWIDKDWNEVEVSNNTENIVVKMNDEYVLSCPWKKKITGGVSLSLKGKMKVSFDNIHLSIW